MAIPWTVLPPLVPFNIEKADKNAYKDWLSSFNIVAGQLTWGDAEKLANVHLYLHESTKSWKEGSTFADWATFLTELEKEVDARTSPIEAQAKLRNRRKLPTETYLALRRQKVV